MNQNIKKLAEQYALECIEELEELLSTLGKIPAPSRQEDMRADFCRDWFLAQGAKDVTIDNAKNVICKIGCEDYDDLIVFMAHTDIVFPDLEPLTMRKEGRKLYAPGIGDDTSNLVNLMMACKYLLKNNIATKTGFLVVANSCEEGLGNLDGCKEIFAAYGSKIKAFYSFDGYMSQCCSSAVGSYRYRVTVRTKGGHSYLNFGEPNAIDIISGLVGEIYKMKVPEGPKTTYNVGRIEGGTTVNTLAQEAYIFFEFRSIEHYCLEIMEKQFSDVVDSWRNKGGDITVELLGVRPGNGPLDKKALEQFTAKSADIISNFFDKLDFDPYSTDANVPLSLGILANTIGTVSGGQAHTREEWVDLDSLPTGLKIALSLMLEYTEKAD